MWLRQLCWRLTIGSHVVHYVFTYFIWHLLLSLTGHISNSQPLNLVSKGTEYFFQQHILHNTVEFSHYRTVIVALPILWNITLEILHDRCFFVSPLVIILFLNSIVYRLFLVLLSVCRPQMIQLVTVWLIILQCDFRGQWGVSGVLVFKPQWAFESWVLKEVYNADSVSVFTPLSQAQWRNCPAQVWTWLQVSELAD